MRLKPIQVTPLALEDVNVTEEEILADLLYPLPAPRQAMSAVDETTRTRTISWEDPLPAAQAGASLSGLEYMQAVAAGDVPPPPIAVLLRFGPVEIEEGRVVFEGEPGEEHYNPIGTVHGGYAATLLDSAIGCAVHTTLPVGGAYSTQTLEAKFVRPINAETGTLRCEAHVLHRGRRQATAEARIHDRAGKLVAHGTGTCLIL